MSDLFNENENTPNNDEQQINNVNETINSNEPVINSEPIDNTEPVSAEPINNAEPIVESAPINQNQQGYNNSAQYQPQSNESYPYGNNQNFNNRYYGSPFSPNQNGANPNNANSNGNNGYQYNSPNYQAPPPPPQKNKTSSHKKVGLAVFITVIVLCVSVGVVGIAFSLTKGARGDGESTGDGTKITLNDTPSASDVGKDGELTAVGVHEKIRESSVGVLVYAGNQKAGEGSGVIMGQDATGKYTYIITCAHVINMAGASVKIQLYDEKQYNATVIGYDAKTDIGVLRVEASGLKAAEFGDSTKLSVGETVYAIGNPGGTAFAGSFTNGMVSAISRPVGSQIGYELLCIQHTAAINPGNSGGALLNAYGQIIGINSSKIASEEYEGMGFAVPSETVKMIFDEIVANGYVTNRPKLGITYYPAAESQSFDILSKVNDIPAGAIIIQDIQADGALGKTDAQKGDLITKVNGKSLEKASDLPSIIEKSKVGDVLTLTICRLDSKYNTTEFEVKATLVEDKGTTTVEEKTTASYYNPFAPYGD